MSSEHVMLRAEGVGKRYRIGAREPYKALRDVIARGLLTRRCAASSGGRSTPVEHIWALEDISFDVQRGEVVGLIGAQRRRQEHAAQGPVADHRAHGGPGDRARPRRLAARGRHRLPSRADRAREHLPERHDPRDAEGRDPAPLRRDRRVRGDGEVPRHAGEALLERDAGPARVRRRRAPRARDPPRRRGARGRRRRVPAEVPREDAGRDAGGPDGPVRQPQPGRCAKPLLARARAREGEARLRRRHADRDPALPGLRRRRPVGRGRGRAAPGAAHEEPSLRPDAVLRVQPDRGARQGRRAVDLLPLRRGDHDRRRLRVLPAGEPVPRAGRPERPGGDADLPHREHRRRHRARRRSSPARTGRASRSRRTSSATSSSTSASASSPR